MQNTVHNNEPCLTSDTLYLRRKLCPQMMPTAVATSEQGPCVEKDVKVE
jgi:hypothetical protein